MANQSHVWILVWPDGSIRTGLPEPIAYSTKKAAETAIYNSTYSTLRAVRFERAKRGRTPSGKGK